MQIVIDPDGSCEFTRNPQLLDILHPADRKSIERMTDIKFHPELQRYYIVFLKGPYTPLPLALTILLDDYYPFSHEYGGFEDEFQIDTEGFGLITFATYEDAVRAEVRYVEFLRDLGYSMK